MAAGPVTGAPYAGVVAPDPYMKSPGQSHPSPGAAYLKTKTTHSPRVAPYAEGRPGDHESALRGEAPEAVAVKLAARRALEPFGGPQMGQAVGHLQQIDPSKRPVPVTLSNSDDELAERPPAPDEERQEGT